jgi:hypothetical protein
VRATPTPEGTVVGALAIRNMAVDAASMVTLIGSQSGWARIALGGADFTASTATGARPAGSRPTC